MSRVALVTGASRGLGKLLATAMAESGYTVYGGMRTLSNDSVNFHPIKLDLTSDKDIVAATEEIARKEKNIDIVIHNAGLLFAGPPDSFTIDELRYLFEVNVFGPFRLTQLVLPYMRKQKEGRLLFISSIRAIESHFYRGLYSASKSALEAIAFDWAVALKPWNIKVSVIEAGPLSTNPTVIEGSYFEAGKTPYPTIDNLKFVWQSPEEIFPFIDEILKNATPNFRCQPSEYATTVVSTHLKDISGNDWLKQQQDWFMNVR